MPPVHLRQLYTVASRYLPADNATSPPESNLDALSADVTDPFAQADLAVVAELVLNLWRTSALLRQDSYVSGITASSSPGP
jgi:hypothetical protein